MTKADHIFRTSNPTYQSPVYLMQNANHSYLFTIISNVDLIIQHFLYQKIHRVLCNSPPLAGISLLC